MKVFAVMLNVLKFIGIGLAVLIAIALATYEPMVHDDSETFRLLRLKHIEDSIIMETGKGSMDTMSIDTVKMIDIFSDIFPEKN